MLSDTESRVFLHIGYPKTATTTLQKHLFAKHSEIEYYGKFNKPGYQYKTTELERAIDYVCNGATSTISPIVFIPRSDKKIVLCSSKSFTSPYILSFNDMAARLRIVFGNAKVILTIRRQEDLLYSLYAAHGRFGDFTYDKDGNPLDTCVESFSEWLELIRADYDRNMLHLLHYDRAIETLTSLFSDVLVLVYEEMDAKPGAVGLLQKLCAFLNVNMEEAFGLTSGRYENISVNSLGVLYRKCIRILERKCPSLSGLLPRYWQLFPAFRYFLTQRSRRPALSSEDNQHLYSLFAEGNARIAERYGLPLASHGYLLPPNSSCERTDALKRSAETERYT